MAFYDNYEQLCRDINKTPTEVGRENGIQQGTISMWKKRGSTPNASTVAKLSDYFGVSVENMLTGEKGQGASFDIDNHLVEMSLIDRVQTLASKRGLTLQEVEKQSGVPEGSLSRLENNPKEEFDFNLIYPLSIFFNTSLDRAAKQLMKNRPRKRGHPIAPREYAFLFNAFPGEFDETTTEKRLLKLFQELNIAGQEKAVEDVQLLTEIPKYQKGDPNET